MSDTRDKAAREHFEATTGGHWTRWSDSQQKDALQDFKAGWDAAVAARPLPDRETIAAFLAGQNWSSEQRFDRRAFWFAKADAILSLFTTDTTEENPNG